MSDQDWLYDYIITFLKSPPWTVPIANFIDQNCIIFDAEEENKLIYTEIHQQFTNLIESLLTTHLTELGVTNEQFVQACERGRQEYRLIEKLIFGQIVAVDDFLTFKKMMYKRNMELEVEALKALSQTTTKTCSPKAATAPATAPVAAPITPKATTPKASAPSSQADADLARALALSLESSTPSISTHTTRNIESHAAEKEQIKLAVRASLDVQELHARELAREQAELEHAIALSLAMEAERLRLLQLADAKTSSPSHTPTMTLVDPPKVTSGTIVDPPLSTSTTTSASVTIVDPPKPTTTETKTNVPVKDNTLSTVENPTMETSSSSASAVVPPTTTPSSSNIALGPLRTTSKLPAPSPAVQQQQFDLTKKRADELFQQAAQERKKQPSVVETVVKESGLSSEELQRRQTFLREQKQRILAAKNKERVDTLRQFESERKASAEAITTTSSHQSLSEEEKKHMAMRDALTKQLKQDMAMIEVKRREERLLGNLNDVSDQLKRLESLQRQQQAH